MANESAWEQLHFAVIELVTSTKPLAARAEAIAATYLRPLRSDSRLADRETREWIGRIVAAIDSGVEDRISQALIDVVALYDEVTRQDNEALQAEAA